MRPRDTSPLWTAVAEALARGATVVFPGRHAAQDMRRRYDEAQRKAGLHHWTPPAIRSWNGLLEEMWREQLLSGATSHLLLSNEQERLLWHGIIVNDDMPRTLAGSWKLAQLAQEAWALVCTFRVRAGVANPADPAALRRLLDDGSLDVGAFARWAAIFHDRCLRDRFVVAAELPERLATAVVAGKVTPRHTALALFEFDDLTPAQHYLLNGIRRSGISVDLHLRPGAAAEGVLVKASDSEEEILACARWCVLQARAGVRVAVVSPAVESIRPALRRALHKAFLQEIRQGLLFSQGTQPFGFGSGTALRREPVVRTAIAVFRLAAGPLPVHEASSLLQSPCFATSSAPGVPISTAGDTPQLTEQLDGAGVPAAPDAEQAARATFDAQDLRRMRQLQPEVSLDDLQKLADTSALSGQLVQLRRTLRSMQRVLAKKQPERQSYGRWAERMRALLRTSGWGRHRGAGLQLERAAHEGMDAVLDSLATLDFAGERVTYSEALALALHLIDERRTSVDAASVLVAIHSPEDMAGMEFEAMWCLGAGEMSWPMQRASSALLPRGMQRSAGMPGVDRAQEIAHAARLFQRLRSTAPEYVFSYPGHTGTARQRAAFPLQSGALTEVQASTYFPKISSAVPGVRSHADLPFVANAATSEPHVDLEAIPDLQPIAPLPESVVYGGASLLATQAACAFRAFAEHRLGSSPLETPELGTDPRRVGEVVHRVLEQIWNKLQTQAELRKLTTEARSELLLSTIDSVLATSDLASTSAWGSAFLRVERERLRRLLEDWLRHEATRPAFEVEGHEIPMQDAQIGPLRLRLRIDRVDRVGDARVLIDYKTGDAGPRDWEGDRPDAPQLPLYAVLSAHLASRTTPAEPEQQPSLAGIAFARIKRPKLALDGIAARADLLPSASAVTPDFAGRVAAWRTILEALATAFASGDTRVDPKHFPETCKHCDQRMLCRLNLRTVQEEEALDFGDYV